MFRFDLSVVAGPEGDGLPPLFENAKNSLHLFGGAFSVLRGHFERDMTYKNEARSSETTSAQTTRKGAPGPENAWSRLMRV